MAALNLHKSFDLWQQALALIPGGSQTMSKRAKNFAYGAYPIYVDHAKGAHVWDVDGNEYIDYVMALGPVTLGYRYPCVDQAIRDQLEKGIVFGLLSPIEVEAARELVDAIPCAERVRFLKSGAEATSAAVRIARAFTGRQKVASCGYHGWHDQWSAGRNDGGIPEILKDYTIGFAFNDASSAEKVFAAHPGEIAAAIITPTGRGGPDPGYLEALRKLTSKHGALLIFDEIVTGFRLARGGAQEYFGVVPDLACFAKGMANGMPVAAVVGRRDVMQKAENLVISTTYGGEALSLAALVAACREYRTKPVFKAIWQRADQIASGIDAAAQRHGFGKVCDSLSPMATMQLTSANHPDADPQEMWFYVLQECASRGVLLRRGGCLFVTYSHSEEDAQKTVAVVDEVLRDLRTHLEKGDLARELRKCDEDQADDIRART
ncbi:MAG: aminotransferase class III-fold pyridoxal phosphate-dependent enzyme [Planctomycetes bacterium]|nr:aminotransferase class III-fold pyridoxal phosphate-dependent enzyme [Planctomycetota bacterium]